jgi:hypothetical protein
MCNAFDSFLSFMEIYERKNVICWP